jgi:hypothetical protein
VIGRGGHSAMVEPAQSILARAGNIAQLLRSLFYTTCSTCRWDLGPGACLPGIVRLHCCVAWMIKGIPCCHKQWWLSCAGPPPVVPTLPASRLGS